MNFGRPIQLLTDSTLSGYVTLLPIATMKSDKIFCGQFPLRASPSPNSAKRLARCPLNFTAVGEGDFQHHTANVRFERAMHFTGRPTGIVTTL